MSQRRIKRDLMDFRGIKRETKRYSSHGYRGTVGKFKLIAVCTIPKKKR